MSSQTAQPQVQNSALAGSSASSIKLVQQQVQGFIQGLNNEELNKLIEIFEKSLSSPSTISKSCKMVQYKCYESKIDLNGKVGCGFGRSEEDAIAISIKDFFEIILQEEKYLYQVKECFRQMKGQTQSIAQQAQNSQPAVQNLNQINAQDKTQPQNKIVCKKVESETENSPTERKMPNQVIQDIDESEINPSDNNQDYQMADNQISLIEMQINESNVYELSKKIGNISVINGPNVIASTNFNNNSQQDIDEMLLKIMFEEEKKFQQQNSQHSQLHSHQQASNINQINFNQYLNSLQNSQSNQPLTQFQIYQMQYLQQQQQQQQQFQLQNKNQGSQLQLQQIQQYFQSQQNSQGSYFQTALNNQQLVNSNTNIINSSHMKTNDMNNLEQQQQQQEELSPQSYENVSTPPNKNKRSSLSINNRAQQSHVNQQLNDTAFMPTKNVNTSNNNTSNSQNNQQKLLRNNSIQNNNNHSCSQQEHQSSHFSSQQNGSNFLQNNIQNMNNYNVNTQNSQSLYANKENSFQNQNNLNLVNSNNNLSNTQSNFGLANKPINQIASQSNAFNQTAQINHQNSKTNLHLLSTNSSCCNHKEELERERNKVENLEKKIKLLMEENKILKSLLLDNQSATTSQTIKNKLNSNQTPRGQLLSQNNTTNTNTNQNNNIQEQQTDFKNVNNNNNSQHFSNTKIAQRTSQTNMRSQSQDPTSKYLNNNNNQIITHTQYSSGQKKTNFNTSDSKNNYLYGSSGKYANDDLNTSHISLNNSSQLNHSSMKKNVPKLNLEVLPNYHGNFNKSQNNKLLQEYNQKYMYKKRF
ncbi:hypothetical protein TTHERM_01051770 (macronuclear) [Tetrahymena thermophila SB210]|uniref:Uncharacterized protein n=1 Tax=Tetrahymena thermophila (strain SB210) TaxID=312017 RepID=Q235Q2_TETTS|nr:hypothetical protein TTHERM_01051770 [Tetrahymena thermophila SB210]EAR92228.1 hypothetical protein TTHERM_01051770 [Tetrahymena thermophila SB210]|eukprot:XP_001012473.1 hypothetical protein TTHERM_01051770 [Tetrahymena thermophila SB210]